MDTSNETRFPIGSHAWCGELEIVITGPPDAYGLIPSDHGHFAPHVLTSTPTKVVFGDPEPIVFEDLRPTRSSDGVRLDLMRQSVDDVLNPRSVDDEP